MSLLVCSAVIRSETTLLAAKSLLRGPTQEIDQPVNFVVSVLTAWSRSHGPASPTTLETVRNTANGCALGLAHEAERC